MSEEQKLMVEVLTSMKAAIDKSTEAQEKLTKEVKTQREELERIKQDTPEFLSSEPRRGRPSPKTQEDILKLVDEMLLLEKDDRPEFLSERAIKDRLREEGLDKVGDIFASLLHRAYMHDIPLRFPRAWEHDEDDD